MRIRKTNQGREPPPGVTGWRRRKAGGQVAAARAGPDPDLAGQAPGQEARAGPDASDAVAAVYQMHYRSLVQLTALLVSDPATAEDIVQDSFAALHGRWHTLPDTDAALGYLRRAVVRRSRAAPRLRAAGDPQEPSGAGGIPEAGLPGPDSAVVSALRALPARQREVVVLRHFAELSDAEIASATGMSATAVRSQVTRAMASLHAALPPAGE
jgi:RNA polymerase sigma-70 factor (sigma-E family)